MTKCDISNENYTHPQQHIILFTHSDNHTHSDRE